ncbi:MAG: CoA-disulfide reductase [Tissierellia bacterium]|nr:CoA-disulfide reductase [Tissierellia bacterium]
MKFVIVGGVAGGATAAARLRRIDEKAEIVLFERGEYISYANCGLPYYIGDVITNRESLLVQTVEGMESKFNLDIRNLSEVVQVDPVKKKVHVKNLKTEEVYEESYDKLLLSPGAYPIKPPIPGLEEADNVFTLRNVPDTDAIKEFVSKDSVQKATVIGGGFIGIEMAENFHHLGMEVTLIEAADQIMGPIDIEMARLLQDHMENQGVRLILEDGVEEFLDQGKTIRTQSGIEVKSDITLLAIGVKPDTEFLNDSGIERDSRGFIKVNEKMETSIEDIYAVGDAILFQDGMFQEPMSLALAGPANRCGRIVANNMCGIDDSYQGFYGTSVAKVFDLDVAATGFNEKTLRKKGIDYRVVHSHPLSNAGYYPGSLPMNFKLLFEYPSGKVLGAQAVGGKGIDKRIDVIATALYGNMTVRDLTQLELCYAPPFGAAKDPVNLAGYAAENILDGMLEQVSVEEVDQIIKDGGQILDVREVSETIMGEMDHAVNIPVGELRNRLDELDKGKIYVICQVGVRGYLATRILKSAGFDAKNIDGGYESYLMSERMYKKDQKVIEKAERAKIPNLDSSTTPLTDGSGNPVACSYNPKVLEQEPTKKVDARGLQCPGPIAQVYAALLEMNKGEVLEVKATDPGFARDIEAWCSKMGNSLLELKKEDYYTYAKILKGRADYQPGDKQEVQTREGTIPQKDGATFVVFSGDFDKAMAAFIIATGAAAMGKPVNLFFTFWGLNIIRKKANVEKEPMEKMFGAMMPCGADQLNLSNMNMMGMGKKMIKKVMEEKNVDSLGDLIENARGLGVNLMACAMSMDIMGIKQEELLDDVEIVGVATYLAKTEESNLNLFI